MKRNYSAFIFRVTISLCVLSIGIHYVMKGVETHGSLINVFNAILPSDHPFSFSLKTLTLVGSVALLVFIIKSCIKGLEAPRSNWKSGLNALASAIGGFIGVIAFVVLYIIIWTETKNHITTFFYTVGITIVACLLNFVCSITYDWIIWKFRGQDNDEYYEDNESE